ncbi:MAG: PHB depolymerase family esterase [bacterium]
MKIPKLVTLSLLLIPWTYAERAIANPSCSVTGLTCTTIPGNGRSLVQCLPSGLGGSTPRALVIGLHGGGSNPDQLVDAAGACRMNQLAKNNNFVAVYPQGTVSDGCVDANAQDKQYFWKDCRNDNTYTHPAAGVDDVAFIRDIVDAYVGYVGNDYKIDPNKVYVWGESNGGLMAYRVGRQLSDRVAAIAAVIANEPSNSSCNSNPLPISPTPTLIMNSDEDPLMPNIGGEITGLPLETDPPNTCTGGDTHGSVESIDDTTQAWLTNNGCNGTYTWNSLSDVYTNDGPGDPIRTNSHVEKYTFTAGCTESARVEVYAVIKGGHRIPEVHNPVPGPTCSNDDDPPAFPFGCQNADITAADTIWSFFSGKTLGSTVHVPMSVNAGVGTLAGGVTATYNDDNSYVTASNAVSPSAGFSYYVGPRALTSLNVLVRSKDAKSTGTTRKIYLFNYATQQWVQQASSAVGTSESETTFTITTNLNNYRESAGYVDVAVEHARSSQTTTMSVDRVLLGVNQ